MDGGAKFEFGLGRVEGMEEIGSRLGVGVWSWCVSVCIEFKFECWFRSRYDCGGKIGPTHNVSGGDGWFIGGGDKEIILICSCCVYFWCVSVCLDFII